MNKPRTIEGRWWIFGRRRPPYFGILNYDPEEGLRLDVKIAGPITEPQIAKFLKGRGSISVPETVIESDEHDNFVSLFGCFGPTKKWNSALFTISVQPMRALLGVRCADWKRSMFPRVGANFTLLHNWMGKSSIVQHHHGKVWPTLSVRQAKPIKVPLSSDLTLTIRPTFGSSHNASGITLTDDHNIEIRYKIGRINPDQLLAHIHKFRRLLTLFTGTPVFPNEIWFYASRASGAKTIQVLHTNTGVKDANRSLLHSHMLVSFTEVANRITDIIARWYLIHSQIDDALNLYFATIFNRALYTNQHFLLLAQALEVYHRFSPSFDGYVQPKKLFRERKRRILEAVPNERDWLNAKLSHANEKNLAERLREIVTAHANDASRFITDTEAFVQLVKNTRNHFTHYSTKATGMGKVASGVALMQLTDHMRTLLEICVFKDLGISGAPIARIIGKLNDRRYFNL